VCPKCKGELRLLRYHFICFGCGWAIDRRSPLAVQYRRSIAPPKKRRQHRRLYPPEYLIERLQQLARDLGRTPRTVDLTLPCHQTYLNTFGTYWEALRAAGMEPPRGRPGWGAKTRRGRIPKYWTEKRVLRGMRKLYGELGVVPNDRAYLVLKKGRLNLPPAMEIRRFGGNGGRGSVCWKLAWEKAGFAVPQRRSWATWSEEEDRFLLENAGRLTLKQIAVEMGRSWHACKRRCYDLAVWAREARGWYTGQRLAQELNVSLARIYGAIHSGRLRAERPPGRPYWQIDPASVEENRDWLTAPKKTHTSTPPRTTDWYQTNGVNTGDFTLRSTVGHA